MRNKTYEPGNRVCSTARGYYYRLPGTVRCKAQMQFCDTYPQYIVDLDNGATVRMTSYDMDLVTAADIERYKEWTQQSERQRREAIERAERKRQARKEAKAARAERRQAEAEQKQAEADEHRRAEQDELRRKYGRVYGLESLKR